MHVAYSMCVQKCVSRPKKKRTLQKCISLAFWAPFISDFAYKMRDGQKKKKLSLGSHFGIFGKLKRAPLAVLGSMEFHFETRGVVYVCGAVCVCGKCRGVADDVLNDVFFEKKKNALGGDASL